MTHLYDLHTELVNDTPTWMHPSRVVRRTMVVTVRYWWLPFVTFTKTVSIPR